MTAIAKHISSNPVTFKSLEVSTAHISPKDNELMHRQDHGLAVYPYEFGDMIYVGGWDKLDSASLIKFGFTPEFVLLINLAAQHGCKFLYLDRDGVIYEDLPKFDWE